MVRTKQTRKTKSRGPSDACDSIVKDFERQCAQKIHKLEADLALQLSMLENMIDVTLVGVPKGVRKLTLGEILTKLNTQKEVPMETTDDSSEISSAVKTTGKPKKAQLRATAASDDGYATESTTARGTHISRINTTRNSNKHEPRRHRSSSNNGPTKKEEKRISRSSSRSRTSQLSTKSDQENRNNLLKTAGRCPPSSSKFKTPAMKNGAPSYAIVTPKIKPNTPMNVLRRPRQGEMVLSMQGSPLLVSSIVQERTANINVPLQNGDVISLLPNPGLRLSHMPEFDDTTLQQLKTLNNHLNKVFSQSKQ